MGFVGNKGYIEFGTSVWGNPNYGGNNLSDSCVYYANNDPMDRHVLTGNNYFWLDILDTTPTINNFEWACNYADNHKFVDYDYSLIQDYLIAGGEISNDPDNPTSWEIYRDYVNSHVAWIMGDVYGGRGIATFDGVSYFWVATYRHYTKDNLEKISCTRGVPSYTRVQLRNCIIVKARLAGGDVIPDELGRYSYWFIAKEYYIQDNTFYYPLLNIYNYLQSDYVITLLKYEQVYEHIESSTINGFINNNTSSNVSGTFPKTIISGLIYPVGTTNTFYDDYELDLEDWDDETESPWGAEETNNPNADGGITNDDDFDGEFGNEATGADGATDSQFTIDAVNSGFVTLYNPTKAQIKDFNDFLFSGITSQIADTLKRLVSDPLDYVLSLSMCHLSPPSSGAGTITFGGFSSGVSANVINKQIVKIDCGSKKVPDDFGSFLDYSGFSKVKIYLPYIGTIPLNNNEVRGGNIHVIYWVDLITGSCTCEVKVSRSRSYVYDDVYLDEKVLYTFNGNVFQTLPITARDFKSTINALMSIAGGVASVATGSATGLGAIASGVMNITPDVQHSGQSSMSYGYMAEQKPYLILERPMQALPSNFGAREGYMSNIYVAKLGSVQGYNEIDIESFKTEYIKCTDAERDEILNILGGGFII